MAAYYLQIFIFLAVATATYSASLDDYLNMKVSDKSSEEGLDPGSKGTNCSCGWSNKARIVGGRKTLVNEFPLMAGLKAVGRKEIFCGGTIITRYHVLTAAHCTYPLRMLKSIKLAVVVGEHDQTKSKEAESKELAVLKIIEHENYHQTKYFNDISMIVLDEEITFTQTIGPACLPSKELDLTNQQVKVLGWGRTTSKRGGPSSKVLRKLNLKVIPLQICKENFKREILVDDPKQVCTVRKNKDSCEGDSGGPLIWLDPETNRYHLVALVSYGKTECASGAPAVNTDVSKYIGWIQATVAATRPDVQTCSKLD